MIISSEMSIITSEYENNNDHCDLEEGDKYNFVYNPCLCNSNVQTINKLLAHK